MDTALLYASPFIDFSPKGVDGLFTADLESQHSILLFPITYINIALTYVSPHINWN
jgi:hypothetical protein